MQRQLLGISVGALVTGMVLACAPVHFKKDIPCLAQNGCIGVTPNGGVYDFVTMIGGGKVDILIVDDNSASMSTEQNAMATRFSSFITALDNKSLDYRIAVTTSDVSASSNNGPRAINGNGALQDGKLIAFGDGSRYLTPSTPNKTSLFSTAIQRQETLTCEAYLNGGGGNAYSANCPSPDERGVYAANLTVSNNPNSFIRADAALAIVFLSDEDVRSSVYTEYISYALENNDLPQTLISNVSSRYPGKVFKMHSIIVRPGSLSVSAATAASMMAQAWSSSGDENPSAHPTALFSGGDSSCLATQIAQVNNVRGSYGYIYALATRMTNGVEGDVCASDYGSQLATIGDNIGQNVNTIAIQCTPNNVDPADPLVVTFLNGPSVTWSHVGNQIQFSQNLTAGTQVKVHYKCVPVF